MKKQYSDLFQRLVKSYFNDSLEKTIEEIFKQENFKKEELANIISSLCGVEINFKEDSFIKDLKKSIQEYTTKNKIVNKIKQCSTDCEKINGKTKCQRSCPFDAILINKKGSTYIDAEKCTDCGFCVEACPTGSILDKVQFIPLINLLKQEDPVIAIVAPAISGQFGENVTMDQLRTAFKKLGFADMIEVAFFADMLSLKEAVEFSHHIHNKNDLMITSCCCPMWVGMIKKIYTNLVKYVSPSVSPMIAAGKVIKKINSSCKIVFIGPCIAKKAEAKEKDLQGIIDFVLTFSEVDEIFKCLNLDVSSLCETQTTEYASKGGRLYARTGGVSIAIEDAVKSLFPNESNFLNAVQGNGVIECKKLLSQIQEGTISANFIEGMGCVGGCVGGPKAITPKEQGTKDINDFANNSSIKVPTESSCMKNILEKIGIDSIEDFKDKNKTNIFERKF